MPTLKEIAERAGVSIGTVDRVIHNRGRVSRKTLENVRRIIEQTDYKPNMFAKNLKLSKYFIFGVVMPKPSDDDEYWALPINGINRAQQELSGHKVDVKFFFYDKYSEKSLNDTIPKILGTKLDGLLMVPALPGPFEKFAAKIPKDVPCVFFDSFIPNLTYITYIGQDSFRSGFLAGHLMHILIKEPGYLAVIKVLPEGYHITDRVNGFLSYFEKYPDYRLRVYDLDVSKGSSILDKNVKKIFDENPTPCGIFVSNAYTHLAAEYVQANGLKGKVHIIGYDPIEKNIKYLKNDVIDFLISQQSEKQGYEGIYSLYRKVVLNFPSPKKVFMQLDIITKENVAYYHS